MELIIFIVVIALIWLIVSSNTKKTTLPTKSQSYVAQTQQQDLQAKYIQNTLNFAKEQHRVISDKRREQDAWLMQFGKSKVAELDKLSGVEFEQFLAGLFRKNGYEAELTALTGDYGADLILSKAGQRIAVQAKRYAGSVGVQAVQEALSGQAYYQCNSAWLVTTGTFTNNAIELAKKSGVKMVGRNEIGILMAKHSEMSRNG